MLDEKDCDNRWQSKWDFYQKFIKTNGASSVIDLVSQRDRLKEFIEHWVDASIEDRGPFRDEGKELLANIRAGLD